MNQKWLIDHVLDTGPSIPLSPNDSRSYLSLAEAGCIVDAALDELESQSDRTEYTYMRGHRKRLMHALTMIPKADENRRSLLDVGCYGYMGFWAKQHLGYEHVVGIEWHPEIDSPVIHRELQVGPDIVRFDSYNIDITQRDWPITDRFDTVLFFEVLEHVNEDPMGVMDRINARMNIDATLVMSVPNAISYKALREFVVGMPPWTYWFYEPDLSHEPRHCFEYTPVVFQSLLMASGMNINAMRTIYAYSSAENERATLEIANVLGFKASDFGETMIAQSIKTKEGVALRYPDVLYSPDGYYESVYPRLQKIFKDRIAHFRARTLNTVIEPKTMPVFEASPISSVTEAEQRIYELIQTCETQYQNQEQLGTDLYAMRSERLHAIQDRDTQRELVSELQGQRSELQGQCSELQGQCSELQGQCSELETQVNQLLFQSDLRLQQQQSLQNQIDLNESTHTELHETRAWADQLAQENGEMRAQINELLFACDCYLQQLNDPSRCIRVIRTRRFRTMLDRSKAIARKTPVVRTALRPVYRSAKRYIKRRV